MYICIIFLFNLRLIICFLFVTVYGLELDLDCDFRFSPWDVYTCYPRKMQIYEPNVTITGVTGVHELYKSIKDVKSQTTTL